MNKKQLINQSKKIKNQADKLLNESCIIDFLSGYGDVHITGSYFLDLMFEPDIDIHIINKNFTKTKVIDVLNKLIKGDFFYGYLFFDFVKTKKKGFPKGYYIGLKKKIKGVKWVFDLWFLTKHNPDERKVISFVSKSLNEENRIKILHFKNLKIKNKIKMPSCIIYNAVLKEGINTFKDLKIYNKKQ